MDWDDLRYMLAVKRGGSLAGAAGELGVTRTTVGRRLAAAEERLGVRLFDRTPEGFVPTPAGEELAETALLVESEILATEGRLVGRDAALHGRLRVSTVSFVFEGFPDVFASFIDRYPGIELTVQVTNDNVSLQRREADVALRLGNSPAERLVGRKVGQLHFELYGTRSLVEEIGLGAPLQAYPWLHWDERSEARWLDEWLAHHAPGARVAMRCDGFSSMYTSVRAGLGVHFLPCILGDRDPELVALGPRLTDEARDLWLLTLPELRTNSRIRAFMDHAFEAFKPHRAAMLGEREA